ncbi:hypothetical protein ONS95_002818 [Cadophora gregata]|uniref:uncharacterized protein n=1 Tax=Cadophora gregata TaxID=51156 RepID=UPI0026DAA917|nr:uncharacterized protein ONS95_002818 [Cadophora gregata]KAK0110167.1 hypothetical protein ONS95_002818 [Cadophora gregata]KAK0110218.1 hypothetical protein ONS96_001841 [Cadophora gregata f. sp. sojae]
MYMKSLALAAAISTVAAQNTTSFCDKYTTALFMNNTAENQLKLLTAVVNTAVIGNYSESKTGKPVAGILAKGMYNGVEVDLLPYFNGGLLSTNRGGSSGVSVNFLDDGGAAPLMMNKPAEGTNSLQYMLLTHLYEYFGSLLQCSQQGMSGYPAYAGDVSQYEVHKFMNLDPNELGYFITQVADSALSFGVSSDDLAPVGKALNSLFGYRCSPKTTVIPAQGAQFQSICSAKECPIAPNSTCDGVPDGVEPAKASGSGTATATMSMSGSATASATGTGTGSGSTSSPTVVSGNGAGVLGMSALAVAGGVVALFL